MTFPSTERSTKPDPDQKGYVVYKGDGQPARRVPGLDEEFVIPVRNDRITVIRTTRRQEEETSK